MHVKLSLCVGLLSLALAACSTTSPSPLASPTSAPTAATTPAAFAVSPAGVPARDDAGTAVVGSVTPPVVLRLPSTAATAMATTAPATTDGAPPVTVVTLSPVPAATSPAAPATAAATIISTAPPTAVPSPVAPVLEKAAARDYVGGIQGAIEHNTLGSSVQAAREVKLAEQSFGSYGDGFCSSRDSLFLWREDTRQIYFLISGNIGLHADVCRDFWKVFPDDWRPGDPNNDDLAAPPDRAVPRAGFGKVWRDNFYQRSPGGLDFPKAPERYLTGTVQQFERGTAFYLPDARAVYVLLDPFKYVTRSGTETRPVWFGPTSPISTSE